VSETIVIERRFRGPEGSGNGGYTCGRAAALVGASAEVTLRLPPPLDRPLHARREEGRVLLFDGDALVAEAVPAELDLELPDPVSIPEAEAARARYAGFEQHEFPTCFVCGPDRDEREALRLFPGPVEGRDLVAAPWTPASWLADEQGLVRPEFVWAALDCPGAFAVGFAQRGAAVLGRFAARIGERPRAGEPHVVVGWPLGEDGRKLYAGTAILDATGRALAFARATWILPRAEN